jgi:excisionase family DNA binding protein
MTTRIRRPTTGTAPDLLTVEEAGRVLRVGRTTAYAEVRRWFAAGGAAGLPAVRVGRQVRVPRRELEDRIGTPITWPIPDEPVTATTTAPVTAIDTRSRPPRRRRSRSTQPTLPLPS